MKHITFNLSIFLRKKYVTGIIILLISQTTCFSKESSDSLYSRYKISLLTYSAGNELYSAFGHSAIRVVDNEFKTDVVYNYGTFSFKTPNFYGKFIKGKLPYFLSKAPTAYVINDSKSENRYIIENEILLNNSERSYLVELLKENYLPENRYYLYDFFFDNCATRIVQIVDSASNGRFSHNLPGYSPKSFSKLVSGYLGNNPWGEMGIKLITGAQIHEKASVMETCFLPEYLQAVMEASTDTVTQEHLLGEQHFIVQSSSTTYKKDILSPLTIFILYFIIVLILKGWGVIKGKETSFVDYLVLLPPILIGSTLLALWSFSNHEIYAWNYSLLWANPIWILFLIKRTKRIKFIRLLGYLLLAGGTIVTAFVLRSSTLTVYVIMMWVVVIASTRKNIDFAKN